MGDLVKAPVLSAEIQAARPGQKLISMLHASLVAAVDRGILPAVEEELEHYHADGIYGRRCKVPAGCVLVSRVHLSEHITIALVGTVTVFSHDGTRKQVSAPGMFVTPKGTHRAVYCHTDVEWVTVHRMDDDTTDIDEIENALYRMEFNEGDSRIMQALKGELICQQ